MTEQHPGVPGKGRVPFDRGSPAAGMLLLVAAMMLTPATSGIAKYLTQSLPPLQVVWARYFFHFLLFLPFVAWRYGWATFRPRRPVLQVVRGLTLLASTCCFIYAIRSMPLADALAVLFVYPFIVTLLSPLVLGDAVGRMRWTAVSIGFLGTMIIIRPGFETVSAGTLFALGAGFAFSTYVLITRSLRGGAPALVTLLWTGLIGTLVTTALLPTMWVMPTATEGVLMVMIGATSAFSHYMIILAYERASAPQLAPFGYVEIIGATFVGYMFFGDFPDVATWIGIAVVIASGLFIAWREHVRGVAR